MATKTVVSLTTPTGIAYQQPTGLFINNEFVGGSDKGTIDVLNPATEQKICSVSEARENDIDKAVSVARKALNGPWRLTTPTERSQYIYKLAMLMEESAEKLAAVESMDNGKPINSAREDIGGAIGCLRYYAGWADKIEGRVIDTDPSKLNYTRRKPLFVLKTAEITPLSALVAAELIVQAGFPSGVINIVTGYGNIAGSAISRHMGVDKIAFTGSTAVGRQILKDAASSNLKKVTLELGGKSPNIVFNDADLDRAASWVVNGIFSNMGQNCCAGSRIYVQSGIYDAFIQKLKEKIQQRTIGPPEDEKTAHGAQVSKAHLDRILGFVDSGKKAGANVETGGNRVDRPGYFMEPTIFSDVSKGMEIAKEEIFGPVGVVGKFETIEEIIETANDTAYGLASGIHTENLKTAIEVSNNIKAGTVWVNQYNGVHWQLPFGGYKQSGIGRELGEEALFNYTQTKTVSMNLQ
ncbi:Aldehyde dehydrogenase, N-terminal [Penicillium italicum]|uniref:Aldehyde dehydrogenase n=1 Tax=Penicillium italicum TaxID=40296 RepID=A0A0A2KNC5_PENIT|nr:Aldehyde dehydrogenase, N-terminal [Penicillium italicum]